MESPYTEPYVRWFERTDREIIPIFLLDFPLLFFDQFIIEIIFLLYFIR